MTPPATVWITRAEPGAAATAARVAAMGLQPLTAPVLTVRPLDTALDLDGVGALAFTSANGVRAFAERTPRRDLKVFAVGAATAEAAHKAGFSEIASAEGDVAALAQRIAAARPQGVVLHPGPRQRAGDLAGALHRAHIPARTLDLYETVATPALPAPVVGALAAGDLRACLIHSPRAAEVVARLTAGVALSGVAAIGLSPACLRPLRSLDFQTQAAAQDPNEDALLAALAAALLDALGNPPRPRYRGPLPGLPRFKPGPP